MNKSTKRILIVFIIGLLGFAASFGYILLQGPLASRDNAKVIEIGEEINTIELYTDIAHVELVESDEKKIELQLNLWADEEILAQDVAVKTQENGALTLTETAPQNKFFGLFKQPYEIFIKVYAPQSLLDNVEIKGETK